MWILNKKYTLIFILFASIPSHVFLYIIWIILDLCQSFSYTEYIHFRDHNPFHGNQPLCERFRMHELNDRWIGTENVSGVQKEKAV